MSGVVAPLDKLTPEDRGPVIVIVAYSLISVTVIAGVIRAGLATYHKIPFKFDDATFAIAASFASAASVCYHLATNAGLGKHITDVSPSSLILYYKIMFTAELLGIVAMAFAKASVVLLSHRVAERKASGYKTMLAVVASWAVFSILAVSFQCQLPHPWVYVPSECSTHGDLQYPIISLNLATDVLLAAWILPALWKLKMAKDSRAIVMILFGLRVVVPLAMVGQLVAYARHSRDSDQTWASFSRGIWDQLVIHLSVICATIPRTNQFIVNLQGGLVALRITEFELNGSAFSKTSTERHTNQSSVRRPETSATAEDSWTTYIAMTARHEDDRPASSLFNQNSPSERAHPRHLKEKPKLVRNVITVRQRPEPGEGSGGSSGDG